MKKVVQVFPFFAEAEVADWAYYRNLTLTKRIDILLERVARHRDDEGEDTTVHRLNTPDDTRQ